MGTFALFPLLIFVFIAFVIIMIIRAVTQGFTGGGSVASLPDVATQIGDDGFWIVSCAAEPQSIIHYYYWTAGVRRSGHIPFQPDAQGRQFVYTGDRPEQVSITRIVEVSDDSSPSILPPIIDTGGGFFDSSSSSQSMPSSSSSGFPSAY